MHLKEDYDSSKSLLDVLKYNDYAWDVIGYFKMVALLLGPQCGFTKSPRYLRLWDIRDNKVHYHRLDWPQLTEFSLGKNDVKREILVNPQKVLI